MKKYGTVEEYIASYPPGTQTILRRIRQLIKSVAPRAVESISYGMPGYKLAGKPLAYFAAWEKHIGFYATPSGQSAFKKELAGYKSGRGSVQFPLDEPIPYPLIRKMLMFKRQEINKDKKI